MIQIGQESVPKTLFQIYLGCIRDSLAGMNVFTSDLARADCHSRLLEYCEGDPDAFENSLAKAVEMAIRQER